MRFFACGTFITWVFFVFTFDAGAQTLVNPDVSVVGDFRAPFRTTQTADAAGSTEIAFEFEEIEFNFNAYLNPYMRADVFVGLHGTEGPVELEEGSITILRGLPASMQLKAGKYLLDFGKINTQHPHQWSWQKFPLMHRSMLGEEGARVVGVNLSTMQPVGDNAVTLSVNAFSGEFFGHQHHNDDGLDDHEEKQHPAEIMFSGRMSGFRSITDALSIESGVSYFYGKYDPGEELAANLADIDLKLKWRPDSYRAVVWIAEAMYSDRDVAVDEHDGATAGHDEHEIKTVDAFGGFSELEIRFRKQYDVGTFVDFTENAVEDGAKTTALGLFVGYMPAEETARFSVAYRHETSDLYTHTHNSVTFQIVWALGPHKPHTF